MDLKELQRNWEGLAQFDPLWSILTHGEKRPVKWDVKDFFETGNHQVDALMDYLRNLGIELSYDRALDFGCGIGRITKPQARYFLEVCGVDIAPTMIDWARKNSMQEARCKYYLNETDNLQLFPDATFDCVVSLITLQHIAPQYISNYISEFLRVLRPGGALVFNLPTEYVPDGTSPVIRQFNDVAKRIRTFVLDLSPKTLLRFYRGVRYGVPWGM